MAHDSILFNLHDLTLLFAVGQNLLLCVLVLLTRRQGGLNTVFLILILLFNALQSTDVLMIWSELIRDYVLSWNPNLLFWGGLGFWLQGPLLYWYLSSVLYRDFTFSSVQLLHLIPVIAALLLLYWHYYSLPRAQKIGSMQELEFMFDSMMETLVTLRYMSVIAYGIWCFHTLSRYQSEVRQQYAGYSASERRWLHWIVIGVVTISAWSLFVHQIGNSISVNDANLMGLVGNYLTLVFVITLVFLSIRYGAVFDGLSQKVTAHHEEPNTKREFNSEYIQRIQKHMEGKKPYLKNDIHIEVLAKQISIPVRTVSNIINHHFNMNFFEFINSYRIAEAKRLLASPDYASKTVLEIIYETGFGSKSSFNSTFKQHVKMTPSEFRKKNRDIRAQNKPSSR
jgi:AraC-like DNA-binding protein